MVVGPKLDFRAALADVREWLLRFTIGLWCPIAAVYAISRDPHVKRNGSSNAGHTLMSAAGRARPKSTCGLVK
jgi:hypothetical protein